MFKRRTILPLWGKKKHTCATDDRVGLGCTGEWFVLSRISAGFPAPSNKWVYQKPCYQNYVYPELKYLLIRVSLTNGFGTGWLHEYAGNSSFSN